MKVIGNIPHPDTVPHRPRLWILGKVVSGPEADQARRYVDNLMQHGVDRWMEYDAVANEQSHEVATSPANDEGHTRSLHALLTDDSQQFHIHLPQTAPGSVVDAEQLKNPESNRLLFIVTGKRLGSFEWAEAKGPLMIDERHGLRIATGAVEDCLYVAKIKPYTLVVIELTGGIHRFHNVRALSMHRKNPAKIGNGDNLVLNTQQWDGDMPARVEILKSEETFGDFIGAPALFENEKQLEMFMQNSANVLVERSKEPIGGSVDVCKDTPQLLNSIRQLAGWSTLRNEAWRWG